MPLCTDAERAAARAFILARATAPAKVTGRRFSIDLETLTHLVADYAAVAALRADLAREVVRVTAAVPEYEALGPTGALAAKVLRRALEGARVASTSSDGLQIRAAVRRLLDCRDLRASA